MNLLRNIITIVIFSFWTNILYGQYIFNHINEDKGLPSNSVNSLIKDQSGFIWLGTQNGICRFDGNEIIAFNNNPSDTNSLFNNNARTIMQDHEGLIWVGTRKGISVFNPKKKNFTNYFHNPSDSASLSKDVIQFIFEDTFGNIILSPDANGIDVFNRATGKFTNYLPSYQADIQPTRFVNTLLGYLPDPNDSFVTWFGSQLGVLKFNIKTKSWKHIELTKENAVKPELFSSKENVVRDMLMDESGKLWLATWGGGLCYLDPESGKFSVYRFEPLEPINGFRNNITKLHWKSRNEIWILAQHKGIAVFNTLSHEFNFLTDPANGEIINMSPSDIICDNDGFIYISSFSNGLYFTNLEAHKFNRINLPYNLVYISSDLQNSEIIYSASISSHGKLVKLDVANNRFPTYSYTPKEDLNENHFAKIITGKERIWLLENYDLFWWDSLNQKIQLYTAFNVRNFKNFQNTDNPYFISGCESSTGELWIGTKFNGIFRLDTKNQKFTNYYFPDESVGSIYFQNFIFSIFPDNKGRIWYASTDFGYFDPTLERFVNLSFNKDFPDAPVKSANIRTITQTPEGNIWLGTENNGIIVINPEAPQSYIKSYTLENGLRGIWVKDMITDDIGDVWALTEKGLSHIIPATGIVENFDEKYGLAGLNRLAKSKSGEIYISSFGGFYHFRPGNIKLLQSDIKPYFKSFRIFDELIDLGNVSNTNNEINLKYQDNFFSIEYGAINYFNPEKTEFSYMLEGLDNQWISAGNRKYVGYTNIPGGNYTFRLRASIGNESFSEIDLPLKIETPFWKTIWFILLIFSLVVVLLYALFKFRMRQITKEEKMKTSYNKMINELEMKALRAQMNPHFLFNSLNSIRYYILKEEFENASDYITKFSKLLRLILRNSRQNMITLREELETVGIYVEFEQMRYSKNFAFELELGDSVNAEEIMIQPMTLQPFMENAIWHGLMPKEGNRKLFLTISKTNNFLTIIIEDNGVGRQKAKTKKQENGLGETKSFGLQITKERFDILKTIRGKRSDFEIKDLFDTDNRHSGTRVIIYYEL